MFARAEDGSLERPGSHLTGGKGSGAPHLPSQSSVLLDGERLFVTNAGSDDVTLLSVGGEVERIGITASGGSAPRSIAVDGEHVWVLNTGDKPASSASASSRAVSWRFPERFGLYPTARSGADRLQRAREGSRGHRPRVDSIHAFPVADDGVVADAITYPSSGPTPYGFDISSDGVLVVTEAAGAQAGKASASSYRVDRRSVTPVSGEVGNTRSEVCWAVSAATAEPSS